MKIKLDIFEGGQAVEVSSKQIADALAKDAETMAEVLEDYLNRFSDPGGRAVGLKLATSHPTLQRSAVVWLLGVICGLGDQRYTDPRNKTAIETAQKIRRMAQDGDLPVGPFV